MIWDMNVASNILCNSLKVSIKSSLYWKNYCALFVPFSGVMFWGVLEEKVKSKSSPGHWYQLNKPLANLMFRGLFRAQPWRNYDKTAFAEQLSLFETSKILYQILLIQRSGCLKLLSSMVGKTLRSLVLVSLVWLGIIWHARRERTM